MTKAIFNGWKLPLLALVGFSFALYTIASHTSKPPRDPIVQPPVSTAPRNIAGLGVVEPSSEIINLGTETSGIAREIFVKVGDKIKKGDPLFALDNRDTIATIKTLEASLEAAKIQQADAQAQFDIAQNLIAKKAVAQDTFNQKQYAAALAAARVKEIEAQLDKAQTTLERLTTHAPIDGQVLELNLHAGEFAPTGQVATPMLRLGQTDLLHVRVEIDEENVVPFSANTTAEGFVRADTKTPIKLSFVRAEPLVSPKQNLATLGQRVDTRVIQILFKIDPPAPPLYIGQQLDVFIQR